MAKKTLKQSTFTDWDNPFIQTRSTFDNRINLDDVITEDEFITNKIKEARQTAVKNSYNKTKPNKVDFVPRRISPWQRPEEIIPIYEKLVETPYKSYKDSLESTNKDTDEIDSLSNQYFNDLYKTYVDSINKIPDKVIIDPNAPNCIYNATNNYGKEHTAVYNPELAKNPGKYGFRHKELENLGAGDIIQIYTSLADANDNIYYSPVHAGLVSKLENDNIYINETDGDSKYKKDERLIKPLSQYIDLKEDSPIRALEFVGTPADSAAWKNEYRSLRKSKKYGGHKSLKY